MARKRTVKRKAHTRKTKKGKTKVKKHSVRVKKRRVMKLSQKEIAKRIRQSEDIMRPRRKPLSRRASKKPPGKLRRVSVLPVWLRNTGVEGERTTLSNELFIESLKDQASDDDANIRNAARLTLRDMQRRAAREEKGGVNRADARLQKRYGKFDEVTTQDVARKDLRVTGLSRGGWMVPNLPRMTGGVPKEALREKPAKSGRKGREARKRGDFDFIDTFSDEELFG